MSLTVTEGGYYIDEASGELQEQHPNIQYDLAHPLVPRTVLGYLAEALARRKENGQQPFTVMSCDNLPWQRTHHTPCAAELCRTARP